MSVGIFSVQGELGDQELDVALGDLLPDAELQYLADRLGRRRRWQLSSRVAVLAKHVEGLRAYAGLLLRGDPTLRVAEEVGLGLYVALDVTRIASQVYECGHQRGDMGLLECGSDGLVVCPMGS